MQTKGFADTINWKKFWEWRSDLQLRHERVRTMTVRDFARLPIIERSAIILKCRIAESFT